MRPIFFFLLLTLPLFSLSQTLTGNWYGKAQVLSGGSNNDYLTELIIKQKGNEIEGILGYYFRNGYKSVFIRGSYNKARREITVKNIPVTYYLSTSIDGVDCTMDFAGGISVSKVESRLNGNFVSIDRYKYTCPQIRVIYTLDRNEYNQDSLIKNSIARKLWEPAKEDLVITTPPESVINPQSADTTARVPLPDKLLEDLFKKRSNVLSKEIEVSSDSVRISFYDNGDIDGDSISVFVNNRPILTKQSLTAQALNVYIKLDSTKAVNEISMFAENLGLYPPNTALMVVSDGEHRYEIYLSSNLSHNAVVRLRRKGR